MSTVEIITSAERYRRWSPADRARILAECDQHGAIIEHVAKRNDIATSLIYKWRKRQREDAAARKLPAFISYGTVEKLPEGKQNGCPSKIEALSGERANVGCPHATNNDGRLTIQFPSGELMTIIGQIPEQTVNAAISCLRGV